MEQPEVSAFEREEARKAAAAAEMASQGPGSIDLIGRMNEKSNESADLTGGDTDVDLQDAAAIGEEAPGGDNPTPGQDMVDAIGRAVGLEYQDAEPLGVEAKLTNRDEHRWELDPASSEDYAERSKPYSKG